MSNPTVFMFSGQGSQYYHMGKEFYEQNPIFRRWMQKLNDIVYQKSGFSVVDEMYSPAKSKAERFDQILYTHPAIFMVEYSLAQTFIESGIKPDYVLGTSLGEFTAVALAGVVSAEEMLDYILKQAELIKSRCRAGGMIAVIANPDLFYQTPEISRYSVMAGVNFASHFVISGDGEPLRNIERYLKAGEILFQSLPVQVGFHSPNIDPAENECKAYLRNLTFKKPELPVISCLLNQPLTEISVEYFWNVIRQPINFQTTILEMEKNHRYNYIDLGPSGTLANFVRNILSKNPESKFYSIITPFGQEMKNFDKIKEIF